MPSDAEAVARELVEWMTRPRNFDGAPRGADEIRAHIAEALTRYGDARERAGFRRSREVCQELRSYHEQRYRETNSDYYRGAAEAAEEAGDDIRALTLDDGAGEEAMKRAAMSNVRDPENRSKKDCVCGDHSTKAKKKRKPWRKGEPFPEDILEEGLRSASEHAERLGLDFDELAERAGKVIDDAREGDDD